MSFTDVRHLTATVKIYADCKARGKCAARRKEKIVGNTSKVEENFSITSLRLSVEREIMQNFKSSLSSHPCSKIDVFLKVKRSHIYDYNTPNDFNMQIPRGQ